MTWLAEFFPLVKQVVEYLNGLTERQAVEAKVIYLADTGKFYVLVPEDDLEQGMNPEETQVTGTRNHVLES